ncbi:hypothetical protein ACTJJY_24350 [Bacillus sp. 22475]|uniref:hypothetical protein n=1 Tax=Bacillus TaxID=1386 RepID=UPI0007729662|nr:MULTISPECIES: hypothetical protein [Bacillus]KXI78054.1 hypothetical protein ACS52_13030 [Bacillus cereus]HDR7736263.1 hypothetical protein [Bacillus thuringiensis]MCU4863869.1 hypothetical protein [Bacillus cereus]MDA1871893.1 hypothetical protein [Bacillus cereus]MED1169150.1 hypothetical protein [Bacillus paranthracis]
MFKKFAIGALVTGIALTGGIGSASASVMDTPAPAKVATALPCPEYIGNGKYARTVPKFGSSFAESFTEYTCHGKIKWYLKSIQSNGAGYYEGSVIN